MEEKERKHCARAQDLIGKAAGENEGVSASENVNSELRHIRIEDKLKPNKGRELTGDRFPSSTCGWQASRHRHSTHT